MKVTKKRKALVLFCLGYRKTPINKGLKLKSKKLNKWIEEEIGEFNLKPIDLEQKSKQKKSKNKKLKEEVIEPPCFDEIIKKKALYLYGQKIPKNIICKYLKISNTKLYIWINNQPDPVKSINYVNKEKPLSNQAGFSSWNDQIFKKICNL